MKKQFNKQPPHVVVIGAGIIGAAIAFHLTERGARVTVIDSDEPGHGASHISFAWINAYGKEPAHYHDLNRRSMDLWDRFARRLGQDVGLRWGGELRWAATEAGAEQLIARARRVQAWGYPTRILGCDEAQSLEPNLPMDGLVAASYTESEGHVDVGKVVRACLAGAIAQGAEICLSDEVSGFQFGQMGDGQAGGGQVGDRPLITAVHCGNRVIPCDRVVIAGGADTPMLAALAGVELPLYHTPGITIVTEPMPPIFQTITTFHSPREADPLVNCRQFVDGTVMVQGGSHGDADGDRGRTEEGAALVLADTIRFVPALAGATIQEIRRGRRPIPQDGIPILGFTQAVPNLYVATTHSGVTLAPLIGEFAAIEIVEAVEIERLAPYRLARFDIT